LGWAKESVKNEFIKRGYAPEQAEVFARGAAAQLVQETGWDAGSKQVGQNNFFNIKETKTQKGDVEGKRAYDKAEGSNDVYAGYSTPEKGIAGYVDFLTKNPRYAKAGVFNAKTPEEYAAALQKAGFATDPNYAKNISSIMSGKSMNAAIDAYQKQAPSAAPGAAPIAPSAAPGAAPIAPSAAPGAAPAPGAPTTPLGDRAVAMKTTGAAVDLSGFRQFNKEEKESFSNLNTEFAGRVSDLAKRYKEATGNELGLGESGGGSKDSLYRSVETQQKLKEQYGANAAKAGYSAHGLGLAADLDQKAMEWAANTKDPTTGKSILESVGLARVAPNKKTGGVEKWHVTPQELGAEMGQNQKLLAIQNQFAGKGNGKLTGDEVLQQAGVQLDTISSAGKALAAQGQPGAAPTPSLGQVAQGVAAGVPAMLASQGVPGAAAVSGAISNVQQGGKTFAGNVESAIKSAADATGVPLSYMRTMAQIESSGDPTAHRTNSKYTGLYQFDEATAASVGVKDRNDAGQAALGAAKLAQKNIKSLKGYGIDVDINKNPELAYLAHQQGAKGAADIIKAAQTGGPVSDRLRKTMDANGGKGMNAAQFLEHWKKTYDKKAGQVGHQPGETDTAAPTTQTPTAPSITAAPTTPTAPAPTRVPISSGQMDTRRIDIDKKYRFVSSRFRFNTRNGRHRIASHGFG
jgi:hypothetical protein